jgi:hypothetical protein
MLRAVFFSCIADVLYGFDTFLEKECCDDVQRYRIFATTVGYGAIYGSDRVFYVDEGRCTIFPPPDRFPFSSFIFLVLLMLLFMPTH